MIFLASGTYSILKLQFCSQSCNLILVELKERDSMTLTVHVVVIHFFNIDVYLLPGLSLPQKNQTSRN